MRFIVDAHLPRRLCLLLGSHGHDAIHTRDLPSGNRTRDAEISELSLTEHRVVVSKDSDFYNSHLVLGRPWRLLLVRTGNISTADLCNLIESNIGSIESALESYSIVEIDQADVRGVIGSPDQA